MTTSTAPKTRTMELAGGEVHMLEAGSGPPLVVLHHSTGALGWRPLHEKLAETNRVILPDMPGYSRSTLPEWARDPRDLAILMLQLLRQQGLSDVTVVGLGFGGFIAAEMATMNTDILSRLVLVGAAGIKPPEGEILDQMLIDHAEYTRLGFRDAKTFDKFFGDLADTDVASLWEFNRVMTARVCWKPYMFSRRLPHLLPGVTVPTLLVWGEKDRVVPLSVAREYARLLPNAKLEVIKAAGHLVDLEEPEKLARLIQSHAG